jgi:hypothetical protein
VIAVMLMIAGGAAQHVIAFIATYFIRPQNRTTA